MALRFVLILVASLAFLACDDGPAPPSGTYALELTGTRTVRLSEEDPGTEEAFTVDTTAVLYVDEGAFEQRIEDVWSQQGYVAPRKGRLFELRLFPYTFANDASTATLAGVFDEPTVEAIGVARRTAEYVSIQFEGEEELTNCSYYEKVRELVVLGDWSEDTLNISMDAVYLEACVDLEGVVIKNGYPDVRYDLEGTLKNMYAPIDVEEAP